MTDKTSLPGAADVDYFRVQQLSHEFNVPYNGLACAIRAYISGSPQPQPVAASSDLAQRLQRFRRLHWTHWSVEENELIVECFHALSAPAVEPVAVMEAPSYEHQRAIMEGHRVYAADRYFNARNAMLDTRDRRNVFDAGFNAVWGGSPAEQAATQAEAPEWAYDKNGSGKWERAAPTAPTGAQAEPMTLKQFCAEADRIGLTAETFAAQLATRPEFAEQAAPKAEPSILRELTDALRESIDFKSDIKVADLIRRAETVLAGHQGDSNA